MTRQWRIGLLLLSLYGGLAAAQAGRGQLLYTTYCDACHSAQVHWREKKAAKDWRTLVEEVRRWETNANLGWSSEDVQAVSVYLNAVYYRYRLPER